MSVLYEGLDFETYSDVNLIKHGLDRYINGKDFTPLIASFGNEHGTQSFDFILDARNGVFEAFREAYFSWPRGFSWKALSAHNVGFERAVLKTLGFTDEEIRPLLDSAVVSRCQGASSHLEAAAPQLTHLDKLDTGKALIMKFSVPNEWNNFSVPTADLIRATAMDDWKEFIHYCEVDAQASAEITSRYGVEHNYLSTQVEHTYEWYTYIMNRNGWHVDMDSVREMQLRYEQNVEEAVRDFRRRVDDVPDTFFNSTPQMKEWMAKRGVKMNSFDSDHVERYLNKITDKLATVEGTHPRYGDWVAAHQMLRTKEILGGSSLKKLPTIIDLTGEDGRLRNQYVHAGAGQTYRTSGKGVQMQNLKRLPSSPMDMDDLKDQSLDIDNETMGENLRQVFTASHKDGLIFVGDFSSVESRGLAWLAGEQWKIDAYRQGKDIYKVLASKFSGIPYDQITKELRNEGKYSELSCGYQAGPKAVKDFMYRLGFEIPLDGPGGATERVENWRDANPNIENLWATIDDLLKRVMTERRRVSEPLANGLSLVFIPGQTPASLTKQHPGAMTIDMELHNPKNSPDPILTRTFQGCYERGRGVCYYKPSERKTGDLWSGWGNDPKTGQQYLHSIYGGKISGILTQSLCRELFMFSLKALYETLEHRPNAMLIGQFHDEIAVEWWPSNEPDAISQGEVQDVMEHCMSNVLPSGLSGFPLGAEINADFRYIK